MELAIKGKECTLVAGNRVELLIDGAITYCSMLDAIATARDHINLESCIIDNDDVEKGFAAALLARHNAGVQIYLIYDGFGAIGTPGKFFSALADAGVNVLEFNPLNPFNVRKTWDLYHRDHRKVLVIDGSVAFLGGINISRVYSRKSLRRRRQQQSLNSGPWRDTHLCIEGPAVAQVQKLFLRTWRNQKCPPLAARDYFPPLADANGHDVRIIGTAPGNRRRTLHRAFLSAIESGQHEFCIMNAYFVPDPTLIAALKHARRRGVDVKLILPGWSTPRSSRVHRARSTRSS